MGKTSKRKFAQLASVFSRRKGAKEMLGHAPAPSNDNLLLNADPILAEDELANRVSDKCRCPTFTEVQGVSPGRGPGLG